MPGDKVNRVKSIRKWLEKAEKSYSSHKELSGELNLIMARADMTGCRQNQVRRPHQPVEVRCRQRYQKLPHRIQMKI